MSNLENNPSNQVRYFNGKLRYGKFWDYPDGPSACIEEILTQRDGERIHEFEQRVMDYKTSRDGGE